MADRVIDMWKQRALVPAGEGRQKSFVRPIEPDANYDSHESGEVRRVVVVRCRIVTPSACALPPPPRVAQHPGFFCGACRQRCTPPPPTLTCGCSHPTPPPFPSVADQHAFNAAEMCSKKTALAPVLSPIIGGRLRIGFVSVEMHDRPVGRDLINLFESLDVQLLDISCFCLYDLTESKPRVQFEYRKRLQAVRCCAPHVHAPAARADLTHVAPVRCAKAGSSTCQKTLSMLQPQKSTTRA